LWSYYSTGGIFAWLQGAVTLYAFVVCGSLVLRRASALPCGPTQLSPSVVALYIITQELFVALSGGNWMEYYRFLVPTIPLKSILLIHLLTRFLQTRSGQRHVFDRYRLSAGVIVLCLTAILQQTNRPLQAGNCSVPMVDIHTVDGWFGGLEHQLVTHNCAHGRDEIAILPFIRNELQNYVGRLSQVRMLSPQGGYFPYHIRDQFTPKEVYFIDVAGLTTRDVAQVAGKRSSGGLAGAEDLPAVLGGEAGELSNVILKLKPNMVYTLWVTQTDRQKLKEIGYELVWDRPNAVVFLRSNHHL
jgi:hypothetical protein